MGKAEKEAKRIKRAEEKAINKARERRRVLLEFRPDRRLRHEEVEDKYLIPAPTQKVLKKARRIPIVQGYMPEGIEFVKFGVRVRRQTVGKVIELSAVDKVRKNERRRIELTQSLSPAQYTARMDLPGVSKLEKTRWEVKQKIGKYKYTIHYDTYQGNLEGRWAAEVEAPSEKALEYFYQHVPENFRWQDGTVDRLAGDRRASWTSHNVARRGVSQEELRRHPILVA